jgi:MoaA/NifB/PqqE/SkfB family radical SAM enzyme
MNKSVACLTIVVTNRCPLSCAHCGPRSGPGERGSLNFENVIAALDAARSRACGIVNYSGGEPFILGQKLVDFVRAAAERNFVPRVTTGAYWSPTLADARKRLEPLGTAGLRQLFISCSDAHREFVPLNNVIEATRAAVDRGISVCIVLGTSKNSTTSSRSVREAFEAAGVPPPWMMDSPIIPFGRAETTIHFSELLLQPVENFAGPCPSMTQHPTLQPDGQVTGCASVFALECAPLSFGQIHESPLSEILERMDKSTLAAWIHKIGVVELKQFIEEHSAIRFPDRYVNICHLCGDILNNPEALTFLESVGLGPLKPGHSAQ